MTLIIIIITVLISYRAFSDQQLRGQLMFLPTAVSERGEYYRFLTHGFIHSDFRHLLFNMWAFYIFGREAEAIFEQDIFGPTYGKLAFLLFYAAAIVAASIPDYLRHQHNRSYASLGASGGVAALIWPFAMAAPWAWFIFPPLPAFLLGIAYIGYSYYADKQGNSNIGHNAHLWGAVFGLIAYVTLAATRAPFLIDDFLRALMQPEPPQFLG
jgi:membrane associated rhomboid family serine protease